MTLVHPPPAGVGTTEGATLGTNKGIGEGANVGDGEGASIGDGEGAIIGVGEGASIGVGEGGIVGDREGFGDPHICMPFMPFPFLSLQLFFTDGSFFIIFVIMTRARASWLVSGNGM